MDAYLGVTLLCAVLAISILFVRCWSIDTAFADGLPWADLRKEVFKTTRASLRQLINCTQVLQDAYTKADPSHSKAGQPFVVSDSSFQPQIMLPHKHIKWLTTQPEAILFVWLVRTKRRALGLMMSTVDHKATTSFMDKIVGRFLTRNPDNIQADVSEEMGASIDSAMGLDEEKWHEVNLMQTFKHIGDRTGVRALFGLVLCRDQHFLHVLTHYKTLMGIGILLSGHLPSIIRPIGGLLFILPFRFCKASLRSEAANVFQSEGDWPDPAALKKLVLTDSAIRESLRRSSIQTRGLLRAVVSPDGLTLPNGTHVPQGTWLGIPVQAVHMDGDLYGKPYEYNPFRFAKMRSENNVPGHEKVDATDNSDTFLAWTHGRHTCPGRWFAVQNLKLMIAYITLKYEIVPIGKRPESVVFGDANVPSMSTCMKVRRRRRA